MTFVLVALGGLLGAPARYLLDRAVSARWSRPFPAGTVLVNVIGCAALGSLTKLAVHGSFFAFVGTGCCGAFTTFSTFTWETFALYEDGMAGLAVGNVVASLVLGIGAAAAAFAVS